jgi:Zn-dependent protease
MMRGSLHLGKILDIPIQLHASWFLIALLITWSLAAGYFPQAYAGWSVTTYWLVGAVAALLFFASVLIHELGHSVMALRENVPVRSITLFIFGGVAQIEREPPTAGAEFRIAIAGPLSSLGLMALFGGLGAALADIPAVAAPLNYLARVNLLLVVFNMIPGFPLDGGRVLRAGLWALRGNLQNATKWASRAGRVIAYGFIGLGIVQILFIGGLINGLWLAFIGWFLKNAAESNYEQVRLRDVLKDVKARNVMTQECVTVPSGLALERLIEDHVLSGGQRCFFVADGGSTEGWITLHNLRGVPSELRHSLTTSQVMTRFDDALRVHPEDEVWNVLQQMEEHNVNQVPVLDNGSFLGMITRDNLLNNIRLRAELAA